MRELAALRMVWASAAWMAVRREICYSKIVVREEAVGGRAALCADYRNIIEQSW